MTTASEPGSTTGAAEPVGLDTARMVADRLGLDFPERRSADLERGLARAARAEGFRGVDEYVVWLYGQATESTGWHRLAGELTVGESFFFRDRAIHDALERRVLPGLIAERREVGVLRLRLWSAGCSTGEEPYSLAMLLNRLLPDRERWQLTILGTDIDPQALAAARRGVYRQWALRELPDWARRHFHQRGSERYELDPGIREMVTLAPLNLVSTSYPSAVTGTGAMDLIMCRNVLMYLTRTAQRATVVRLQRALVDGGWLVVGAAEGSPELLRPLAPVLFPDAILRRKPTSAAIDVRTGAPLPPAEHVHEPAAGHEPAATRRAPAPRVADRPGATTAARPDDRGEPRPSPVQRARVEADRGGLERASELCRVALEQDRLDPEAHLLLAAIHRERGETAAALDAVRAAIYADPDHAPAHFLLGSVLLQQGSTQLGRQSMETAAGLLSALPPDEPLAHGDGLTAGVLLATARAHLALVS
jgi:chemotaxis protein methyltransferase CheR